METVLLCFIAMLLVYIVLLQKELQRLKEKVRQPLSESEQRALTEKVRELLRRGANVEAVKFVRQETGMGLLAAKQYVDQIGGDL